MKAATAVILLSAALLVLVAPTRAAAQTNPVPTNGSIAGQVIPGDDGAVTLTANPLQSLMSRLTGGGSLATFAASWMPEAKAPAYARSYASAHAPRYATQRRVAAGRTSR